MSVVRPFRSLYFVPPLELYTNSVVIFDKVPAQSHHLIVSISNETLINEQSDGNHAINNDSIEQANYSLLNESRIVQFILVRMNIQAYMAICEIEVYINGNVSSTLLT